jgi:hypothetical protein
MKKFIRKLFGIDKLLEEKAEAIASLEQAQAREEAAKEAERIANLTPKDRATRKGEPWVSVLDTHVNKDNIRNGFFELDWNPEFIVQLKQAGYGYDGDPEEEIVDRWFRDLARNMLAEEGVADPARHAAGYINVSKIGNGKAEVK